MPQLHPAQFADQMALPGMEEHAHPWAGPLAKGHRLSFAAPTQRYKQNSLMTTHERDSGGGATMSWADRRASGGADDYAPGEIKWVDNPTNTRGLAGAMMRSAHHFDFGQDTLPIHSTERTVSGKKFSDRVMPELQPSHWARVGDAEREEDKDKSYPTPSWPGVGEEFHPYQQQRAQKERDEAQKLRSRRPVQRERLF